MRSTSNPRLRTLLSRLYSSTMDSTSEFFARGRPSPLLTSSGVGSLAYTPLIVTYTVEIMPNSLRAKGLTVYRVGVSLALIFNQYVNPVALQRLAWKYYVSVTFGTTYRTGDLNCVSV